MRGVQANATICPLRARNLIGLHQSAELRHMKQQIPCLVSVAILFVIVYFLTEATLSTTQIICGIAVAVLVYSATITCHIRNLLRGS
jgi:uncharacterized membrane protein YiaA